MGRSLSAGECLRQAQEALALAAKTEDADLRNQSLKLAIELTQLAMVLDAELKGDDADMPATASGKKKRKPHSGDTT
jgi:hypothetical protein